MWECPVTAGAGGRGVEQRVAHSFGCVRAQIGVAWRACAALKGCSSRCRCVGLKGEFPSLVRLWAELHCHGFVLPSDIVAPIICVVSDRAPNCDDNGTKSGSSHAGEIV